MLGFIFVVLLLLGCGFLGWFLFTSLFDLIFKKTDSYDHETPHITYIDKSTHTHQNLTIINKDEPPVSIDNENL